MGKVWQYTATEVASSYTFCWLSDGNDSQRAAEFADLLAIHYRDLCLSLQRALTDIQTEWDLAN